MRARSLKNDVPPGALAVSGGVQRNIEGWVQKNRPRHTRGQMPLQQLHNLTALQTT